MFDITRLKIALFCFNYKQLKKIGLLFLSKKEANEIRIELINIITNKT